MSKTAPIPEDATLCERCGYILSGIAPEGRCPECGAPVRASLPEARPGTAWQQRSGVGSWLWVSWAVLRRPLAAFRAMRPVADRRTWMLLWINLVIGSAVPGVMWVWVQRWVNGPGLNVWYLREAAAKPANGIIIAWEALAVPRPVWVAIVCVPGMLAVLLGLTWIETVGVRFFGRRRGWRVTWPIALSVSAHASIGWTIGGVLHAMVPLTRTPMWWAMDRLPEAAAAQVALAYVTTAPVVALLVGMLVFETLVYLGVRECRYANAAKADRPNMA